MASFEPTALSQNEKEAPSYGKITRRNQGTVFFDSQQEKLVSLVEKSSSPSAAYEMIFAKTKDISKAKAGRWLAVLRRDHPTEYHKVIPNQHSHVITDKAQTEKETES